ncbi:MAG: AbrB family transcriptional regulator [Mycobacterium sp.]
MDNNRTKVYWGCCLLLTATLGSLFSAIHVPSGWLIAALVAAGSIAVVTVHEIAPPKSLLRPAQGCIGVLAAAPLAGVTTVKLAHYLGVSLVCSGLTLVLCLACGFVLARVAKTISPATALLSTLAGGASGISTMAQELDVDHRYVALSQYLRLIVVSLSLPLVLQLTGGFTTGSSHSAASNASLLTTLVAFGVIYCAGYFGLKRGWPSPFLLMPMFVALVILTVTQGHYVLGVLPEVRAVAYVVVGWQAGGSFTRSAIRLFLRLLPLTCLFIGLAIGGCAAMAFAVSAWTGLSVSQAYLATTPGGIYAVLAAANDSGAGPIVVTMQVVRLLVMVVAAIVASKVLTTEKEIQHADITPELAHV